MANIRLSLSGADIDNALRRGLLYCDTVEDRDNLTISLKKSGTIGRVVLVKETKKFYYYDGGTWTDITPFPNLSDYVTKEELAEILNETVGDIGKVLDKINGEVI